MITREDVATFAPPRDLALRTPPNWTAVFFFSILASLHFGISIPAFLHGRWEGYLSFVLAIVLSFVAAMSYLSRYEMAILAGDRCIRLRHGFGPFRFERFVPFSDVHAVRLTLSRSGRFSESTIELLCDNEDIECPATAIPRQQALFLAILMGVQLIKASDEQPDRMDREL